MTNPEPSSASATERPTGQIVVVGAGLPALVLVSTLPEDLLKEVVVVDPHGVWLRAWRDRFQRMGARHLRMPVSHCLGRPGSLHDYIQRIGAAEELRSCSKSLLPFPSVHIFLKYCEDVIIPKVACQLKKDRVVDVIKPDGGGGLEVRLLSGASIQARAVVCCTTPRVAHVPNFAAKFFSGEGEQGPGGRGWGPGIQRACEVDLRGADLRGRRVAVVGGGMTAATLCLTALERGADHVTLISRRPLETRDLTYEIGWYGPKRAAAFRRTACLAERMWQLRDSRGRGTLDARTLAALRDQAPSRLTILEGWQCSNLEWNGTLASMTLSYGHKGGVAPQEKAASLDAHHVWLATGSSVHVGSDPLLAAVMKRYPTPTVGGYPWIPARSLTWPGLPLFCMGRLTALALGPAVGELPLLREAAQTIAACLAQARLAGPPGDQPAPWETAAEEAGRLPVLETVFPLEGEDMPPRPLPKIPLTVDVSDLPATIVRRDIEKYSWLDEDFRVEIIVQLETEVPPDKVRTLFRERSLDVWAVGADTAYHFHVPLLYDAVLPARCRAKVAGKGRRLHIVLHKQASPEWRFLKG